MSLKFHFLHSHVNYFPENLGVYSEEMGERFYQNFMTIEKRYWGKWGVNMMTKYCMMLRRVI